MKADRHVVTLSQVRWALPVAGYDPQTLSQPGLAEAPSRPSRESLKTPSRAESRVALNKIELLIIESCYYLAG